MVPSGDLTLKKDVVFGSVRIRLSKVNLWKLALGGGALISAIEKCKSDDAKKLQYNGLLNRPPRVGLGGCGARPTPVPARQSKWSIFSPNAFSNAEKKIVKGAEQNDMPG